MGGVVLNCSILKLRCGSFVSVIRKRVDGVHGEKVERVVLVG